MTCRTPSVLRPARPLSFVLLAGVLATSAGAVAARAQAPPAVRVYPTSQHDFRLELVAELVHPHSMAFTPDGDMLITERPGRLRIVRQGTLLPTPVAGLPDILYLGSGATAQDGREQAGLRDVVLHPNFTANRLLYLSYVKPGPNGYGNLAVARGRFENDRLSNVQDIFQAHAPGNGSNRSSMWGGRIAFDKQGYLFVTLGDRQWPAVADLDGDPDIVYANGDAFEYAPPNSRPWQGVQWLENKGSLTFELHRMVDLQGATSPEAVDLDGDGDLAGQ